MGKAMAIAPPRSKGPHLNALRAFESAGRLKSFAAAAEELSVTPGAVSQHVKALEAWAEGDLFVRNAQGVFLTPLGEELLPGFTAAFDMLNTAVQELRTKSAPNRISIAALPSIAQLWLPRKLGELRRLAPEISVSVVAVETPPNLTREPFDVALFFQDGAQVADEIELCADRIFPVCTPEIAARLTSVAALANETLLHDTTWADDWELWLSQFPQVSRTENRSAAYSLFAVALEEACNGAGVLMAHEVLVESRLASGALVAPYNEKVALGRSLVMRIAPNFQGKSSCKILQRVLESGLPS